MELTKEQQDLNRRLHEMCDAADVVINGIQSMKSEFTSMTQEERVAIIDNEVHQHALEVFGNKIIALTQTINLT